MRAAAVRPNLTRVPSLEAFGRRPRCKPYRLDRPSSETLHKHGSGEPFAASPLYSDERTWSDRAAWSVSMAGRGRAALGSCATMRSLRVLGGAIGIRQLLLVLRRQLRWLDRDGQLVDLARERDLIIAIIYRRSGFRAYVEGLIDW